MVKNPKERIQYRQTERNCKCRVCQREVEQNSEKVIIFHARKDRVHICQQCIYLLASIVDSDKYFDN